MTDTADKSTPSSQIARAEAGAPQATEDQLWTRLNTFYDENERTIQKCVDMDVRALEKSETAEVYLDEFLETSRVVLDGLVALGNVHPILGVAIFAFHAVVSLDIARRENDRKVRAIMIQMQNMMCTMFQLRHMTFAHARKDEKDEEKERLQTLVKSIADDITKCGSDLNYYMDQKFISKMIRANKFASRFQSHVETFITRRAELASVLTAYIAAGVDFANQGINNIETTLDDVKTKLDGVVDALFHKLETPRERETLAFFDDNGGVEVCITRDELLLRLISLAGDVISEAAPVKDDSSKLSRSRSYLLEELSNDLDQAFQQNFQRFEKLLLVQNDNFERLSVQLDRQERAINSDSEKLDRVLRTSLLILDQGTTIRKAVGFNATLKLSDPDLQHLWDTMGLRRSVKAKHFVLSLREFLLDTNGDSWVLAYIDMAHMQSIIEAIDEDSSGFITVNEANKFALSRPVGWSLLDWIVYWAAAWHVTVVDYRAKIYSILVEMHNLIPLVHPANYMAVDDYLDSYGIFYVEALLRSTQELPDNYRHDRRLSELAASCTEHFENIFRTNLDTIAYSISSDADVNLVAGSARVETWIYPLLYLLLQRHLAVFKLALTHLLDMDELYRHSNALLSIFHIFIGRMKHLEVTFNQLHVNATAQLGCFAYGMFSTIHKFVSNEFIGKENILLKRKRTPTSSARMIAALRDAPSLGVEPLALPEGILPSFSTSGDVDISPKPILDQAPYSLDGYWSGLCWRLSGDGAPFRGLFHCVLSVSNDNKIQGTGESYAGPFTVDGTICKASRPGVHSIDFRMSFSAINDDPIICHGRYSKEKDALDLRWICNPNVQNFPDDSVWAADTDGNDRGHLSMTRTPVELVRFRTLLFDQEVPNNEGLARRRWRYALTAVRYQVQAALGSRSFWRERLLERNMWIEYTILYILHRSRGGVYEEQKYLHYEHLVKMFELTGVVHPALGRVYEEIAVFLRKRQYHNKIGQFVCDSCDHFITFSRYQCITCSDEEDLAKSVDFCGSRPQCIQDPVINPRDGFFHTPSHTLLHTTRRIQRHDLFDVIVQSRIRSERIKKAFRSLEERSGSQIDASRPWVNGMNWTSHIGHRDPVSVANPPACALCRKQATLPCFVCATCVVDTVICIRCEANGRHLGHSYTGTASMLHSHLHPLLRIHDSVSVPSTDGKENKVEAELSALTTELRSLRAEISNGTARELAVLDPPSTASRVSFGPVPADQSLDLSRSNAERITALENRFEDRFSRLEARIDGQFSSIVELLQRLMKDKA